MKILQIVNPAIPFPADTVGGTERVVQYLMEELLKKGHDITLMGHSRSVVPKGVRLIPIGTFQDKKNTTKIIWKHLLTHKYDVVHNHGRFIYFLPIIWNKVKKIHTLHLADIGERTFTRFFKLKPRNLILSPCAQWIQEKYEGYVGKWQYVNNGIPKNLYKFENLAVNNKTALTIIGRMSEGKGIVEAIQIARRSNKRLRIAGKIGDNHDEITWFNENILAECDGDHIKYIGPVNDRQKQSLLSSSLALLMLSKDSEAFNLTMLEANACGCPVITYNRYFPKIFIKEGINGFKSETDIELIDKIARLSEINRESCRKDFEQNYTSAMMTKNYLKLYQSKI